MLRPSPNHGTQRLPNDDDDDLHDIYLVCACALKIIVIILRYFHMQQHCMIITNQLDNNIMILCTYSCVYLAELLQSFKRDRTFRACSVSSDRYVVTLQHS